MCLTRTCTLIVPGPFLPYAVSNICDEWRMEFLKKSGILFHLLQTCVYTAHIWRNEEGTPEEDGRNQTNRDDALSGIAGHREER
ncbi:unnamed protein product [Protopolystoma xenopodis]|uniref:Uncharacterized protein n=1 Tax=Protopolystoma xenopodis TaxID=117903 RepID=A0A448XRP4_9PLAT|nr:unnamed protein product [Protopolystoma xenopodis]